MTVLLIKCLMLVICMSVSDASYFEKNLLNDLLKDYNKDMRPVLDDSDSIDVTFGLTLSQIIDVDEKQQIMTTSVWLRQKWCNPFLKWNKTEYGNITTIHVQSSKVWLPDLVLYNNADQSIGFRGNLDRLSTRVLLSSDGQNVWMAPVMLRSKCKINVEYFPFDSQICAMKFGSWTYDAFRLDVKLESNNADLTNYVRSTEWHLASASAKRNTIVYFCCPEPYTDITFYFHIHRRTLFYMYNLIMPLLVISLLIIFVFTLPPESGERISLSITILLAMTVFMLLVTDTIPPTSEVVPLIAKFYMAIFLEMAIALFITCYVLKCYHSEKSKVPHWIKKYLIGKLANFFGVRKSEDLLNEEREEKSYRTLKDRIANGLFSKMMKDNDEMKRMDESEDHEKNGNGILLKSLVLPGNTGDPTAEKMLEKMEIISNRVEEKRKDELMKEQWHVLAAVLDRLAMWTFTVVIIATIAIIFSQSPGYVA